MSEEFMPSGDYWAGMVVGAFMAAGAIMFVLGKRRVYSRLKRAEAQKSK